MRMGLQREWVFNSCKQQSPVNWINKVIIYIHVQGVHIKIYQNFH
jgi:hypothetical protein